MAEIQAAEGGQVPWASSSLTGDFCFRSSAASGGLAPTVVSKSALAQGRRYLRVDNSSTLAGDGVMASINTLPEEAVQNPGLSHLVGNAHHRVKCREARLGRGLTETAALVLTAIGVPQHDHGDSVSVAGRQ
jgi:hypothetical protein